MKSSLAIRTLCGPTALLLLGSVAHAAPALDCSTTASALAVGTSPTVATDSLKVLRKGKWVALESVEKDVEPAYYAAIVKQVDRYRSWIAQHDYRIAMTADARVLMISASKKLAPKRMKLVEETLAVFDEILPIVDRSESDETYREGPWGVAEHKPDAEPVVLIELEKGDHYQSLLESLQEAEPGLEASAAIYSDEPGFAEERVMAAAWQSAPAGFEIGDVWRSKNELVNRLSRMLLYRSFGPQPVWMTQTTGWAMELEVIGTIYCFPYRKEFVGVGEHDGWESAIKSEFKKRKKNPLEVTEFTDWKRGTWDGNEAAMSWGMGQFLLQHRPGSFAALAESNRLAFKTGFTVDHGDGSWSSNPAFIIPAEAQHEALLTVAGEDVLTEASEFFRNWKRYKPAKASSKKGRKKKTSKKK